MSFNNNSNTGWSNKVDGSKPSASKEDPFASLIGMNKSSSKPPTPMASPQPGTQPKPSTPSGGSFWNMSTSTVIHNGNQQPTNLPLNRLAAEQSMSSPPTLSSTPTGGYASASSKTSDPWDLDFLSNASSKSKPTTPIPNLDPFDVSSLTSSNNSKTSLHQSEPFGSSNSKNQQSDPFNPIPSTRVVPPKDPFGDEDDFLGDLGKPYSPRVSSPLRNTRTPEDTSDDFAIAQLMGEGFELEAVQIALQLEGNNVEQARQTLLQQQSIQNKNSIPSRFSSDEEEDLSRPPIPPRRTNTNSRTMPNANMPFLKNINQEQIMQQANEFGTNVFNKASSFFNKSKQRIKETWDEIQSSDFSSAASTPPEFRDRNERRKKFGNYEVDRYGNNSSDDDFPNSHEKYKDDSDDDDYDNAGYQKFASNAEDFNSSPRQRNNLSASPVASSRKSPVAAKQQDPEFDLLGMSSASSFSQSRQQASPSPQLASKSRPPVPTRSSKPLSTSTPPPTDKASTDAQTLSRSDQLRQKGNEFFKLGQYDQAQSHYTQAIDILPANHPNLIPLLNNRTASLLKSGDFNKVIEDCNQIIQLIGPHKSYIPQNANSSSLMAQMNLKEHYGKSVIKLGTALEGLEKFNEAMTKYQDLVQLGSSQFLPQANQGIQRCQKALKPKPKPAYKPPSKPVARVDVNRSDAVQKLRQQQAAQDREDDQKLRITDQVEARVNAWKQGKEANIRALLSSLHTLLWPELNWKTIGLGDVLTEKQVKICYMRAIGKLHPDKLSQTTTVDQKLMANLVFATLNRSWDEFQNNGN